MLYILCRKTALNMIYKVFVSSVSVGRKQHREFEFCLEVFVGIKLGDKNIKNEKIVKKYVDFMYGIQ